MTIFEEAIILRKSENTEINCVDWFIGDFSFLVINTLAKPR